MKRNRLQVIIDTCNGKWTPAGEVEQALIDEGYSIGSAANAIYYFSATGKVTTKGRGKAKVVAIADAPTDATESLHKRVAALEAKVAQLLPEYS